MPQRSPIYNWPSCAFKGLICLLAVQFWAALAAAAPAQGLAMHGAPKYAAGFEHFDYVQPDAPKDGTVVFGVLGSFDSLNPLIVKGVAAAGVLDYVFESLMARAMDEPFSLYGLLAESIETPDDRSSVTFRLRPEARFSDGRPVTVDDVVFSHRLLRDHGRPNHRTYYAKVSKVERVGERGVRFVFDGNGDREMPLIMGLMPVLPAHRFEAETFEQTILEPPIGSGPYKIAEVEPGSRITYARDPNYWGRDLAVNRGQYNFGRIRYDYFRDSSALFEAFKKGLVHVRAEDDPGQWAIAYDFPAVKDGRVVKQEFPIQVPAGMSALVFNTRRKIFSDPRVRRALILMFNFDWLNRTLYHGLYTRTQSYFDRSDLSSHGRPADARERELLAPFATGIYPEIMEGRFNFPAGDTSGRNRVAKRRALELLKEAGYVLRDGKLVDHETGAPFTFEILAATKGQERLLLSYARELKAVGIEARIRQVDSAQYQRRRQTYDFDMIQAFWYASLSPGNEQNFRWKSSSVDIEGTFNFPGVRNAAVDAMIEALLAAKSRGEFVSAVRALDRALLSGNYVVPLFHLQKQWVAHWRGLSHPGKTPLYGFQVDTWWRQDAPPAGDR